MIKINLLPQKRAKRAPRRRAAARARRRRTIADRRRSRSRRRGRCSCSSSSTCRSASRLVRSARRERAARRRRSRRRTKQLDGYAELKKAADEADERAKSINRLMQAKVVPANVLHELGEILTPNHLPTMTEEMASKTGNGAESDPNKRFDLDVGSDAGLDHVVHRQREGRHVQARRRRAGADRHHPAVEAAAGVGVLRPTSPAVRRARHRSRNGHHVLQVRDHRKGGLLMAVDGRFRAHADAAEGDGVRRHRRVCSALVYWQFVYKGLEARTSRAREGENDSKVAAQQASSRATSRSSRSCKTRMIDARAIDRREPEGAADRGRAAGVLRDARTARCSSRASRSCAVEAGQGRADRDVRQGADRVRDPGHVHADQEVLRVARAEARSRQSRADAGRRSGVEERERIVSIENLSLIAAGRPQPRDPADREVHRVDVSPGREEGPEREAGRARRSASCTGAGRPPRARRQGRAPGRPRTRSTRAAAQHAGVDEAKTPRLCADRMKGGL